MNPRMKLIRFFLRHGRILKGNLNRLEKKRRAMDFTGSLSPNQAGVKISLFNLGRINGELHVPENLSGTGVILYFHGGAWILGSPKSHRSLISHISHLTQTKTWAVSYRLMPENAFPAALEDCLEAYQQLLKAGNTAKEIIVMGDSAGGNLALALTLALKMRGLPTPAGVIAISPVTDLTCSGESHQTRSDLDLMLGTYKIGPFAEIYAGENDLKNPLISPLFGNLEDFPPTLIQVGDHEVLLDDAVRFAEKAKASGVDARLSVWPEMFHVFQMFWRILPQSKQANMEISDFVKERLK